MPRRYRTLVLAIVAGAAFGAAVQAGNDVPDVPRWLWHLGVPWLGVAFGLGALERAPRRGALIGAVAMVAATVAYYVADAVLAHHGLLTPNGRVMVLAWGAVGALAGAAFGAAGAVARAATGGRRAAALALLGGALAGEAALLLLLKPAGPASRAVFAAELVVGLALPVALLGDRARAALAVGLTCVAMTGSVVAVSGVRHALHQAGWKGP